MDTECYPRWNGWLLIPSLSAEREMAFEDLDLRDVKELLENSKLSGRRKEGIFERIAEKGGRSFKIVLAESYRYSSEEIVFLVLHIKSVSR
ncbi:MAG: hypothetical protein V1835_06080 [Candidatus Micrarchaeota archaeon]